MTKNKVSDGYAALVFGVLTLTWLLCGQAFSGNSAPRKDGSVHVYAPSAGVDIRTNKVATIEGLIWFPSKFIFDVQMASTKDLPGDRVILINSPGGEVETGGEMIRAMQAEQARGVKQICVVTGEADSMAFNLLSFCDVRLSVPKARFMFHSIFYTEAVPCPPDGRCTAKKLRTIANDLEATEAPYRAQNAKALHMSLTIYDMHSDHQTVWKVQSLLDRGYLNGTAKVE